MPTMLSPKSHTPKSRTPGQRRSDGHTISPNYFGLSVEPVNSTINSSAARFAKDNWSPQQSTRITATSPPHDLPIHPQNNFEAFRKQSERNTFTLNDSSLSSRNSPFDSRASSKSSTDESSSNRNAATTTTPPRSTSIPLSIAKADTIADTESLQLSRSPKRVYAPDTPDERFSDSSDYRDSSSKYSNRQNFRDSGSPPPRHDEKYPRLSIPGKDILAPSGSQFHRAETVPPQLDNTNPTLVTSQYIVNVLDSTGEEILLLDLRVSTHYVRSHIVGALNLCIPTTLLKRSSYTVDRLAEMFKDENQRSKFERWRNCKSIVLYDTSSSQMKEATNCVNVLKKFSYEGWQGDSYILRGGFSDFAKKFPSYLEHGHASASSRASSSPNASGDEDNMPPVIGGCEMPATKDAANPFFGNIRQNMDLIGGVGQISIQHPKSMDKTNHVSLPKWLRKAVDERDDGKGVSEKFLQIEKTEQKRMQEALSGEVVYGSSTTEESKKVQIAGIEKGAKNRYNNIWPFEHSRVKLQDVPSDGCDYVNANFAQTSRSNKKYIATQGPIPATFTDFWNMVWQHDIRIIVMLTAETEGGQVKAHNYWSGSNYGNLKLSWHSEERASLEPVKVYSHKNRPSMGRRRSTNNYSSFDKGGSASKKGGPTDAKDATAVTPDQPHVIVRKFTLSNNSHPFERMREITQLQYSSWPDFGAPTHPAHLLGLVEYCDAVVRSTLTPGSSPISSTIPDPPSNRPVLVHCSAGCGRTGTFCTVDSVVDMLKRQRLRGNFSVPGSVKDSNAMDVDKSSPNDLKRDKTNRGSWSAGKSSTERTQFNSISPSNIEGDWLQNENLDLIEKTVQEFRLQRLSMVQSLRQYVLCYESVLEWIMRQGEPKSA